MYTQIEKKQNMKKTKCYAVMLEAFENGNADQVVSFNTYTSLDEAHKNYIDLSKNDLSENDLSENDVEMSVTYYVSLYDCERVPETDADLSKLVLNNKAKMLESTIVKF